MRTSLALIALLAAQAHGQTVDQTLISVRAPMVPGVINTVTVQMEGGTLGRTLIGASKKLTINFVSDTKILVELPGPKIAPVAPVPLVVTGLRATIATAGIPKVGADNWVFHTKLDSPINLPLGTFLGCRYDMPPPTFDTLEVSAAITKWLVDKVPFMINLLPVQGNLRCSVGVKAADIPAPPVVVGPVATGGITTSLIGTGPTAGVSSSIVDGATISGSLAWVATVMPDPTSVQFLVDGTSLAIVNAPPYSTTLGVLPNGPHKLEVKATYSDKSTKSALLTVTVANAAPTPTTTTTVLANPPGDCVAAALGEWCTHLVPQLTDKDGKVWTLVGNVVYRDKVDLVTGKADMYQDVNKLYMSPLGTGNVRVDSPAHGYVCLVNGAWVGGC